MAAMGVVGLPRRIHRIKAFSTIARGYSLYRIEAVEKALVDETREDTLPLRAWGRTVTIDAGHVEPRALHRAPALIVDTINEGIVYLNDRPVHGIDRCHRIAFLPGGGRAWARIFCEGYWSEDRGVCRVNAVYKAAVNKPLWRLAGALWALAEEASYIYKLGNEAAAADLVRLAEESWKAIASLIRSPARLSAGVRVAKLATTHIDSDAVRLAVHARLNRGEEVSEQLLAEKALRVLEALRRGVEDLAGRYGESGAIDAYGHSHLDTAWLWGIDRTRMKIVKTFTTIERVAEEYRGFKHVFGPALHILDLCSLSDTLCKSFRRLVAEGSLVPAVATWVEADVALPLGESVVRQILWGARALRIAPGSPWGFLWLPDSFVYPPGLPEIMRKAGIHVLYTHKPAWGGAIRENAVRWRGSSAAEVYVFILSGPYGGGVTPESLMELARQARDSSGSTVMAFGCCDGGGGPSYDDMESIDLASRSPVLPRVKSTGALNRPNTCSPLPVVSGSLPTGVHEGVYSTKLGLKRIFRLLESYALELEAADAIHYMLEGEGYASDVELEAWGTLLEAMFHDVVTGVSSVDVVKEYILRLSRSAREARGAILKTLKRIAGERGPLFFNMLPWRRTGYALVKDARGIDSSCIQETREGSLVEVDTTGIGFTRPSCSGSGYAIARPCSSGVILENPRIRAVIAWDCSLESLVDKERGQGVVYGGGEVIEYTDNPGTWDAWDIGWDTPVSRAGRAYTVSPLRIAEEGPLRALVECSLETPNAGVKAEYMVYRGLGGLRIRYRIYRSEPGSLVKAWLYMSGSSRALVGSPYGVEVLGKSDYYSERILHSVLYIPSTGAYIATDTPRGLMIGENAVGITLVKHQRYPCPRIGESGVVTIEIGAARGFYDAYRRFKELIHGVAPIV